MRRTRSSVASMAAPGTDIVLSEERILSYRAFANKIWNAARFVFMNLDKYETAGGETLETLAAPGVRASAPYAAGGEVVLSQRVADALPAHIGTRVELELKGKPEPEVAYRLSV